jgi:membrane protease YdiL (CAAX protease family)
VRPDFRLLAAVIAPLLVWPWIPLWEDSILEEGLPGATVLCVSIAVLEEVLFRGGLQGWLLTRASFRKNSFRFSRANWLTSLIFAAAHVWQHPFALVPGYLAVSLMLGYFRERYNAILVPVALHAWYNLALLFLPVLLSS